MADLNTIKISCVHYVGLPGQCKVILWLFYGQRIRSLCKWKSTTLNNFSNVHLPTQTYPQYEEERRAYEDAANFKWIVDNEKFKFNEKCIKELMVILTGG